MGGTASAAKVQRGGAFDWLIIIIVAGANEPVHQHYAFAFVGFFQRWPIWAVQSLFAAARLFADKREVLEEGDKVVLSAGRACGHGKVGM